MKTAQNSQKSFPLDLLPLPSRVPRAVHPWPNLLQRAAGVPDQEHLRGLFDRLLHFSLELFPDLLHLQIRIQGLLS